MKQYAQRGKKGTLILAALALAGALLIIAGVVLSSGLGADSGKNNKSNKEKELAAFLMNSEGVGNAEVRLCYSPDGERITGAAVICSGGDDPTVRSNVTRLLCAALGIGANRIYVTGSAKDR